MIKKNFLVAIVLNLKNLCDNEFIKILIICLKLNLKEQKLICFELQIKYALNGFHYTDISALVIIFIMNSL